MDMFFVRQQLIVAAVLLAVLELSVVLVTAFGH